MQKIIVILSLIFLFSCKSKKPEPNTIPEKSIVFVNPNTVEEVVKTRAYELGTRLLDACNTSNFKAFTNEEATQKVIKNATKERISNTCKKINFRNGKFLSLNLLEIKHDEINNQYIFRYNINYEKKYFKRELIVVINSEDKVSAISTKEVKPKPL